MYNFLNSLKVADLYQQHQKSARLQIYLEDLNDLLSNTEKLKDGADILKDRFLKAKAAVGDSLTLDLKNKTFQAKTIPRNH